MVQKLSRGLLVGLVGICFALIGCSSDSDRIVSPGQGAYNDQSGGLNHFDEYTEDLDWYDYMYEDDSVVDGPSGGGTGDEGSEDLGLGGLGEEDTPEDEEVDLD
jgi:hypothetical protein